MSKTIDCPYCSHKHEPDFDDGGNGPHRYDCESCEKTFIFEVDWYPSFTARKADCLNGAPHNYRDRLEGDDGYLSKQFSKWLECKDCDHQVREYTKS